MTIEEVIEIAKTLQHGFVQAEIVDLWHVRNGYQKLYILAYLNSTHISFEGESFEDCLHQAGWKYNADGSDYAGWKG